MNLLIVDDEVITTQVLKEKLNRKYLGISSIFTAYSVDMAEKKFAERKCGNYPVRCGNASRERSGAFGMGSQ